MPNLYVNKSQCCGCTACVNICPTKSIYLEEDNKGFLYPKIDENICINCGLCETTCPLKQNSLPAVHEHKAYGVKNKSASERMKSSSGSVFIELAKFILSQKGVVYGVRMEDDFTICYSRAENLDEARKFQGSKYVQSLKLDNYNKVKQDLIQGKKVLFIGTPCEVAGLKNFLRGRDTSGLYTVDIICHGVPSQLFLKQSIQKQEERYGAKVKRLTFRDKSYGWRNQEIKIDFNNEKEYHAPIWEDEFYRLFTSNYILRDCCYSCHYSNLDREGDITIGDFWNIKNVKEAFEDQLGVSSVIINSEKGNQLFEEIKCNFDMFSCSLEDVLQPNLIHPSKKPNDFEKFEKDYEVRGLKYCLKKYGKMKKTERFRRFLSPIKKSLRAITGR